MFQKDQALGLSMGERKGRIIYLLPSPVTFYLTDQNFSHGNQTPHPSQLYPSSHCSSSEEDGSVVQQREFTRGQKWRGNQGSWPPAWGGQTTFAHIDTASVLPIRWCMCLRAPERPSESKTTSCISAYSYANTNFSKNMDT